MATLPVNQLGTSSNLTGTTITGTEPVLELIASAADGSYVQSGANNSTGTFSADFDLANMPADFGNMDTLAVRLRYLRAAGTLVNTWNSLQAQIVDSVGAALSDVVTIASNITTTTATNSGVITFTGLNTTANKATWDNARLEIFWVITKSMGGDSIEKRVTAAELTGTYTAALPAVVGTLAVTETGTDTFASTGQVTTPPIVGTLASTETGSDTLVSTGTVLVQGSFTATEAGPDVLSSTGSVLVVGSLASTETGDDTFASTGQLVNGIVGSLAGVETGTDSLASTGKVIIVGTLSATETADTVFTSTGTVRLSGSLSVSEVGSDTFEGVSTPSTTGSLSVREVGDDLFASIPEGDVFITGNLSATESIDTFQATGFSFSQYPAASEVLKGVHYGTSGELVGTYEAKITLDLSTSRLNKPINQFVSLSL